MPRPLRVVEANARIARANEAAAPKPKGDAKSGARPSRRSSSGKHHRKSSSHRASPAPSSGTSLSSGNDQHIGNRVGMGIPTHVPGAPEGYPLAVHSSICKANGGGRWTPKPVREWDGYRVPYGKAAYEIEMEREEEEERIKKANPIIKDGSECFCVDYWPVFWMLMVVVFLSSFPATCAPRTRTLAPES